MVTPATMEGTARAVPGDPLPLGLSQGLRITRPNQLDFMHRFMSSLLVPSFSGSSGGGGLLLHCAHTLHFHDNCKSEFVIYKLKEMGKIGEKDILQICNQFNKLDSNNTRKITLPDLLNCNNRRPQTRTLNFEKE